MYRLLFFLFGLSAICYFCREAVAQIFQIGVSMASDSQMTAGGSLREDIEQAYRMLAVSMWLELWESRSRSGFSSLTQKKFCGRPVSRLAADQMRMLRRTPTDREIGMRSSLPYLWRQQALFRRRRSTSRCFRCVLVTIQSLPVFLPT
jgi:hypothetical protein